METYLKSRRREPARYQQSKRRRRTEEMATRRVDLEEVSEKEKEENIPEIGLS